MGLNSLDHYNIETTLPEETIAFYCDALGCTNSPELRPDLPFPGTWLTLNGHAAIHVNFVDNDRAGVTGSIDHVAFDGSDFDGMCEKLTSLGIEFETAQTPEISLQQIYVLDPNQVKVEINIRGEIYAFPVGDAVV